MYTICGIQQMTNDIDKTAISFANALSSAVGSVCERSGGPVTVNKGFTLDEDLDIRLRTPVRQLNLLKALETARLHQTIDKHKRVPKMKSILE